MPQFTSGLGGALPDMLLMGRVLTASELLAAGLVTATFFPGRLMEFVLSADARGRATTLFRSVLDATGSQSCSEVPSLGEAARAIGAHDAAAAPLFLYLSWQEAHNPYEVPARYEDPAIGYADRRELAVALLQVCNLSAISPHQHVIRPLSPTFSLPSPSTTLRRSPPLSSCSPFSAPLSPPDNSSQLHCKPHAIKDPSSPSNSAHGGESPPLPIG